MTKLSTAEFNCASTPVHTRTHSYVVVDPQLVDVLRSWRARDNTIPLMIQLGISYNTWRKVQAGEPVRQSIAERLKAQIIRKEGVAMQ